MKSKGDGVDEDAGVDGGGDDSVSLSLLPLGNEDISPTKDANRSISTIMRSKLPRQRKDQQQLISGNCNSNSSGNNN